MSTAPHGEHHLVDKLSWYFGRGSHRVWDRFSADEQERMLRDDLTAGTRVSLLLAALITTGLVLSAVTLVAVVLTQ